MKRLVIENEKYYHVLMAAIGSLLAYNIWAMIHYDYLFGILPIGIQSILLLLLKSKNKYSKISVKIWAGVVLIGAQVLKILGIAMQGWAKYMKGEEGGIEMVTSIKMIFSFIFLIIGIIILIITNGIGDVKEDEEEIPI